MLKFLLVAVGVYLLWRIIRVFGRLFSSDSTGYDRVHETAPRKTESSTGPAEIKDAEFEDLGPDEGKKK